MSFLSIPTSRTIQFQLLTPPRLAPNRDRAPAKVRAMRQQYMHVLPTATDGSVPVAEPGGKVWALYLRDAMPFEDTAGTLCFGP